MKVQSPFSKHTRTVSTLSEAEMRRLLGGEICTDGDPVCYTPDFWIRYDDGTMELCHIHGGSTIDGKDNNSELASGGGTTDTYEEIGADQ